MRGDSNGDFEASGGFREHPGGVLLEDPVGPSPSRRHIPPDMDSAHSQRGNSGSRWTRRLGLVLVERAGQAVVAVRGARAEQAGHTRGAAARGTAERSIAARDTAGRQELDIEDNRTLGGNRRVQAVRGAYN